MRDPRLCRGAPRGARSSRSSNCCIPGAKLGRPHNMITHPPYPHGLAPHPGPPPAKQGGEGELPGRADPSDIHRGDWIGRHLPAAVRPYARLARLDRPIGTWLLLFPGWWGIALAMPRWPRPILLLLFPVAPLALRAPGSPLTPTPTP